MKVVMTKRILGFTVACLFLTGSPYAKEQADKDIREILRLHNELIEAHKINDVDRLFAAESDDVVTVSRGEVRFQTKKERIPIFKQYLDSTKFEEYEDLIEPTVRVSNDGTLGWLIAQVKIAGTRTDSKGESKRFDTVWAWIELYEKKNGRWYRIGDVSNVKPDNS